MDLAIRTVKDKGDLDKERIVIEVKANVDIGTYIIFDTTYNDDDSISSKLRHTYWLPDKELSAGDLVVVYTRKGTARLRTNQDNTKTLFLYWGLDETVWNKDKDCALIIKIASWNWKNV